MIRLLCCCRPSAQAPIPPADPPTSKDSKAFALHNPLTAPPAAGLYEIMVGEGPMGLTLRPSGQTAMPLPKEGGLGVESAVVIDARGATKGRVRVGDALVSINDQETSAMAFRATMKALKNAARPARLVFASAPPGAAAAGAARNLAPRAESRQEKRAKAKAEANSRKKLLAKLTKGGDMVLAEAKAAIDVVGVDEGAVRAHVTGERQRAHLAARLTQASSDGAQKGATVPSGEPDQRYGRLTEAAIRAVRDEDLAALQHWLAADSSSIEDTEPSKHQTALIIAARHGAANSLELLVHTGADVQQPMSGGATALYVACQEGQKRCADLLLRAGAHVDAPMATGAWPLFIAARQGHAHCVTNLLKRGALPNKALRNGATALMIAAYNCREKVVIALLKSGARVELQCTDGKTALLAAVQGGSQSIVRRLLDAGADPNVPGRAGITPLIVATEHGQHSIALVLLDKGAIVDARADDCSTALVAAGQAGHLRLTQLLVKRHAQLEAAAEDGATALFFAVQAGHTEVVKALIKAGADVNCKRSDGTTAFSMALQVRLLS
eukprot:g1758.t1